MRLQTGLRDVDRLLTKQAASRIPHGMAAVLSAVEEAAEGTKLWCATALAMAVAGGWRGRKAAAAGLAAVGLAQLISNGVCKQVTDRPRPPEEWIPHDEVHDRPESSSFPSGHTAAAAAFTAAVAAHWPAAGVVCTVPATLVALERVQSGAHYPSDVVTGALVGVGSAWLIRRAPRLLHPWAP
ncbi:phosphatase PAP2 family protein [Streptomyces sp. NPDC006314]|uniref:phosphatase PAP2 family protein n=1 Tax=Streptomyces sp. NPDC006314 TaxID=3154475 RepID=UPI0033A2720F